MGAAATALDLLVGWAMLCLGCGTRWAAMAGVTIGATFAFLANRSFAFHQQASELASPAMRFVLATSAAMVVHGQVVVIFREDFGVPFAVAKMLADVVVFTFGQLLVLRFIVFPGAKGRSLVLGGVAKSP